MSSITLAEQRMILTLCNRAGVEDVFSTVTTIAANRGILANPPLMAAVKNILLNMTSRDDLRDEDSRLPCHEFALLFTAYAEAGGTLRQDSDTEDWPAWTQDLLADCKESLKEKGE